MLYLGQYKEAGAVIEENIWDGNAPLKLTRRVSTAEVSDGPGWSMGRKRILAYFEGHKIRCALSFSNNVTKILRGRKFEVSGEQLPVCCNVWNGACEEVQERERLT